MSTAVLLLAWREAGAVPIPACGTPPTSGTCRLEDTLFVGGAPALSNGSLTIGGGETLTTFNGFLGNFAPGSGTVTVTGSGSTWNSTGIWVGQRDRGRLSVSAGGAVNADSLFLGTFEGANGTVEVTGSGSKVNVTGFFGIGSRGSGTFTISDGGRVTGNEVFVSNHPGSDGTLRISGEGSELAAVKTFVGLFGNGRSEIAEGARLTNTELFVGAHAGSHGVVTVDGNGSKLEGTGTFFVGLEGRGELAIKNGARAEAGSMRIGDTAAAVGVVQIRGEDSSLTLNGTGSTADLWVGAAGSGDLAISDGGSLSLAAKGHAMLQLGEQANSDGKVQLDSGSLDVSGSDGAQVFVGRKSSGSLDLANGSSVKINGGETFAELVVGLDAGGKGKLTIKDGSSLHVKGAGARVHVARDGDGQMSIDGSGTSVVVDAPGETGGAGVEIADSWSGAPGKGSLAISNGAELIIQGAGAFINIGRDGEGKLEIKNGGKLRIDDGAATTGGSVIGRDAGSTGSVTVSGAKSEWHAGARLIVGSAGSGTLDITESGQVFAVTSSIGGGRESRVNVGAGSSLTVDRALTVGAADGSVGSLRIEGSVVARIDNVIQGKYDKYYGFDRMSHYKSEDVAVFASSEAIDINKIATAVVHEAAHAFGLRHVENSSGLMYYKLDSSPRTFTDAITPFKADESGGLGSSNPQYYLRSFIFGESDEELMNNQGLLPGTWERDPSTAVYRVNLNDISSSAGLFDLSIGLPGFTTTVDGEGLLLSPLSLTEDAVFFNVTDEIGWTIFGSSDDDQQADLLFSFGNEPDMMVSIFDILDGSGEGTIFQYLGDLDSWVTVGSFNYAAGLLGEITKSGFELVDGGSGEPTDVPEPPMLVIFLTALLVLASARPSVFLIVLGRPRHGCR